MLTAARSHAASSSHLDPLPSLCSSRCSQPCCPPPSHIALCNPPQLHALLYHITCELCLAVSTAQFRDVWPQTMLSHEYDFAALASMLARSYTSSTCVVRARVHVCICFVLLRRAACVVRRRRSKQQTNQTLPDQPLAAASCHRPLAGEVHLVAGIDESNLRVGFVKVDRACPRDTARSNWCMASPRACSSVTVLLQKQQWRCMGLIEPVALRRSVDDRHLNECGLTHKSQPFPP
jgi:hypothetical protein